MKKWFCLILLFSIASVVSAQNDCSAIVAAALATTEEVCADIGRNQACYGNVMAEAVPQENASSFIFETAGDTIDVTNLASLRLSSMSLIDETWGVTLMDIQANIPDEAPENVRLVMFGDVSISNQVLEGVELPMTATGSVNVRLRPRTDENNVMASLTQGEEVTANGRLEDGSWIRIAVEDDARSIGWVSADFLSTEGDINTLNVVEPGEPALGPMQAFVFSSAADDAPCEEAPDSGILIQTPEGIGEVNLLVNEVDIRLGSTVYLQTGGEFMTVSVLEGFATLTVDEESQGVPAGTYAQIPLDENGAASGAPESPQPYVASDFAALPLTLLPATIVAAEPLTEEEIESAVTESSGIIAGSSGTANITYTASNVCADYIGQEERLDVTASMSFSEDGSTMTLDSLVFTRTESGSYVAQQTISVSSDNYTVTTYNFVFTSPTTFTGQVAGDWNLSECTYTFNVSGTYSP